MPGKAREGFWARDLLLGLVLAPLVVVTCYQPVRVSGQSMKPSLSNHERLLINRFLYRLTPIRRGDVIVFYFPLNPHDSFIKRVIGLPGDWVSMQHGVVFINSRRLSEPYLRLGLRGQASFPLTRVPQDKYFVLGDNRAASDDSRDWGMVPRQLIYGKAVFAYWPLRRVGVIR